MTVPNQSALGGDFDELWVRFEGQKVTKVILNFAGEVSVTDRETAEALDYLGEVEFTIRGRITGKKFSYQKGITRGQAIVEVHEVSLGDHVFDTKTAERLKAAAEAQDVSPDAGDDITQARARRSRTKKEDPVWDELERQEAAARGLCGKIHPGHVNACPIPAADCDLEPVEAS